MWVSSLTFETIQKSGQYRKPDGTIDIFYRPKRPAIPLSDRIIQIRYKPLKYIIFTSPFNARQARIWLALAHENFSHAAEVCGAAQPCCQVGSNSPNGGGGAVGNGTGRALFEPG
jgi:hypothetical protein